MRKRRNADEVARLLREADRVSGSVGMATFSGQWEPPERLRRDPSDRSLRSVVTVGSAVCLRPRPAQGTPGERSRPATNLAWPWRSRIIRIQ
jgi:hypothetical protein